MARLAPILGFVLSALPATAQVRVIGSSRAVRTGTIRSVDELARSGLRRLAPSFPGTPTAPIRIVVHADADAVHPEILASLHPGVPGFARLGQNEIHIVMSAITVDPPNDLKTTVEHELVHVLLDQYVGRNGRYVARWFHEGLAQDLVGDGYLGIKEEDLVYRVHTRSFIPFKDLESHFPKDQPERLALAYGQSYSFVAFLRREIGLPTLLAAARDCGPERTFQAALSIRVRRGLILYEDEWIEYIRTSGAGFRVVLTNCFSLTLIGLVLPLLALGVARRRNREEAIKRDLAAGDAGDAGDGGSGGDTDDDDDVPWDDWRMDGDEEPAPGDGSAAAPDSHDAGYDDDDEDDDDYDDAEYYDEEYYDDEWPIAPQPEEPLDDPPRNGSPPER